MSFKHHKGKKLPKRVQPSKRLLKWIERLREAQVERAKHFVNVFEDPFELPPDSKVLDLEIVTPASRFPPVEVLKPNPWVYCIVHKPYLKKASRKLIKEITCDIKQAAYPGGPAFCPFPEQNFIVN